MKKELGLSTVKFHLHAICDHVADAKHCALRILMKKLRKLEQCSPTGKQLKNELVKRLNEERTIIEGISSYDVGKYALKYLDNAPKGIENGETPARVSCFGRLIHHPEIKKTVYSFRHKYPQWSECLDKFLQQLVEPRAKKSIKSSSTKSNSASESRDHSIPTDSASEKVIGESTIVSETSKCELTVCDSKTDDSEFDYDLNDLDDIDLNVDLEESDSDQIVESVSLIGGSHQPITESTTDLKTESCRLQKVSSEDGIDNKIEGQRAIRRVETPDVSSDMDIETDDGDTKENDSSDLQPELVLNNSCLQPASKCAVVQPINLNTDSETVDIAQLSVLPATNNSTVANKKLGRNSKRSSFFVGGCDDVAPKRRATGEDLEVEGEDILMQGRRRLVGRQQVRSAASGGISKRIVGGWRGVEINGKFSGRKAWSDVKGSSRKPDTSPGVTDGSSLLRPSYLKYDHNDKDMGSKPGREHLNGMPSDSERLRGNFARGKSSHANKSQSLHPSWAAKRSQKTIDINQKGKKTVFNFF